MGSGAGGDWRWGLAGEGGVLASGCDRMGGRASGSAGGVEGSSRGLSAGDPTLVATVARWVWALCGKAR